MRLWPLWLGAVAVGAYAAHGFLPAISGHFSPRNVFQAYNTHAKPGEPLAEIPGTVPAPEDWPSGCRFSSRCPRAVARCTSETPGDYAPAQGHVLRCHVVEAEGAS